MNMVPQCRRVADGEVDLWFFNTEDRRLDRQRDAMVVLLSAEEKLQLSDMAAEQQARSYVLNRAMLRSVLSQYVDQSANSLEFFVNDFGKPQLSGSKLQFNVAHSSGVSICAVASADVGVDVECHPESAGMLAAADDYLSKIELQSLRTHSEDQQLNIFFQYWTLKEAWLKARGEGLSVPLHEFSILLQQDNSEIGFDGPDSDSWYFRLLFQSESYTAAIALNDALHTVRSFKFAPLGESVEMQSPESAMKAIADESPLAHFRRA